MQRIACGASLSEQLKAVVGFLQLLKMCSLTLRRMRAFSYYQNSNCELTLARRSLSSLCLANLGALNSGVSSAWSIVLICSRNHLTPPVHKVIWLAHVHDALQTRSKHKVTRNHHWHHYCGAHSGSPQLLHKQALVNSVNLVVFTYVDFALTTCHVSLLKKTQTSTGQMRVNQKPTRLAAWQLPSCFLLHCKTCMYAGDTSKAS